MPSSSRQDGVVLMVALIILVALTLAGIALVRSVDTTNIISGNLAFQQAAVHSGEAGAEAGIRSIELGVAGALTTAALQNDNFARAYSASTPATGTLTSSPPMGNPASWDDYWAQVINPNNRTAGCSSASNDGRVCVLPLDAAGNLVSYTIQRLCQTAGDPTSSPTGCASGAQQATPPGGSYASGAVPPAQAPQYYYRITTRVAGPRNTLSYIQTIVAR